MWVPTIVSIVLYLQKNGTNESPLFFVLTLIIISNVLGAFAIFSLVFILEKGTGLVVEDFTVLIWVFAVFRVLDYASDQHHCDRDCDDRS